MDKHFAALENESDPLITASLDRFRMEPHIYFYPPDPTETSASLGGTVATNASGARTYRYGPTRDWVRGLRVVLANGEILNIPRGKYFASPSATFSITAGKEDHPMAELSWYGAAAYCNLRSALRGRPPCYDPSTWECDFSTGGYRLPTEAE